MAGTPLILRVRTRQGTYKLTNLTGNNSLFDLKKAISDLTNIQYSLIKILKGYPPKVLDAFQTENVTLSSLYVRDGDLLTVEEGESSNVNQTSSFPLSTSTTTKTTPTATTTNISSIPAATTQTSAVAISTHSQPIATSISQKQYSIEPTSCEGILLRQIVPANNSCLFTSIYYVVENGKLNLDCQKFMRELIAQTVKADPHTFNEAMLGKKNSEYCEWIKNTTTWGGQIEVAILSKYYKIEICVVDIQTGRIDRFGEDCNYPIRVFIIYDGIHFDPLYLQPFSQGLPIQTRFSTKDESVMHQAFELANEAKKAKQFTDLQNFQLKCLTCQKGLLGEKEAQDHAKATGHINFGEINA